MSRLIAMMAILILAVANYIAVFVFGFGIEVKSWWWLIGCGIFGNLVLRGLTEAVEKEKP